MLNIGELKHRITFQNYRELENEIGETVQQLQDYKKVWAKVETLKGREYLEAKKNKTEVTYKITTRYIVGITADMKIKFKDRIFEISSIINIDEQNEWLQIMCFEKVKKC